MGAWGLTGQAWDRWGWGASRALQALVGTGLPLPEARPLPQASVPQSSSFEERLLHCPSGPRPWCGGEVAWSLRNGSVASSPDLASRQGRASGLQECPGLNPDRTHVGHGGPAGGRGVLCPCPALLLLGVCAPRRGTGAAGPMSRHTARAEEGPRLHPCRPSSSWTFRASVCPAWSQVAALRGRGLGAGAWASACLLPAPASS